MQGKFNKYFYDPTTLAIKNDKHAIKQVLINKQTIILNNGHEYELAKRSKLWKFVGYENTVKCYENVDLNLKAIITYNEDQTRNSIQVFKKE